jgi:hypothetical protein
MMNWSQLRRKDCGPAPAPRLAVACGWQMIFAFFLIPAALPLIGCVVMPLG